MFRAIITYRYGQHSAARYRQNGRGMKKELLTVRKLTAEPRVIWPALTNTGRRIASPLMMDRAEQLLGTERF